MSAQSYADPTGGQVVRGDATISSETGLTTIDQSSNRAVILWDDFSIATDEVVRFNQPSADAAALNRVTGSAASIIEGLLSANGNILIINPAGILFSDSAQVDVGGLVATTADIADDNFMRGDLDFSIAAPDGSTVVNRGLISVADGGLAALVAPGVENTGVIQARLGKVALASGNQFTLDLYGDGLIRLPVSESDLATMVTADGETLATLINNTGSIEADGGRVYLLAATASSVLDQAVNAAGTIRARTADGATGSIVLAAGHGRVDVTGSLDVSGNGAGGTAGDVSVTGDSVAVGDTAVVNATGTAGGGTVLLGGDYQGGGDLETASSTTVAAGARIDASATANGDGGKVIVWGDDTTVFEGTVLANGGANGGDGGFVEVSALDVLQFYGEVFASAPSGMPGTLLIDPEDIVITPFGRADANGSAIQGETLSRMLRSGMHVELLASNSITIRDVIDGRALEGTTGQAEAMLILNAGNTISIQDGFGAVTNGGDIRLTAGAGGISMGVDAYLVVADGGTAGGALTSGVGDVIIDADGDVVLSQVVSLGRVAIRSRSGTVTFNQSLYGADGETAGVGGLLVRANGNVNLRGVTTTDSSDSSGELLWGDDTVIADFTTGDIDIQSTGGGITLADGSEADPTAITAARNLTLDAAGTITIGGQGVGSTASIVAGANTDEAALLSIATDNAVVLNGSVLNLSGSASNGGVQIGSNTRNVGSVSSGSGDVVIQAAGLSGAANSAAITIVSSGNVNTGDLLTTTDSAVSVIGASVDVGTIAAPTADAENPDEVATINLRANDATGSGIEADSLLASGDVTLDSAAALTTGAISSTGGNVQVNADGIATLTGDISAANGTINIGSTDTGGRRVGGVAAADQLLSAGDAVTIASAGAVTVGRIDAVGGITIDANGAEPASINITGIDGDSTALLASSDSGGTTLVDLDANGDITLGDVFAEHGSIEIGEDPASGTPTAGRVGGTVTANNLVACAQEANGDCNTSNPGDVSVFANSNVTVERIVNGGAVVIDTDSGNIDIAQGIFGITAILTPGDDPLLTSSGVSTLKLVTRQGDIRLGGAQTSTGPIQINAPNGAVVTTDLVSSNSSLEIVTGARSDGVGLQSALLQAVENISVETDGNVTVSPLDSASLAIVSSEGSVSIVQSGGDSLRVNGEIQASAVDQDVSVTSLTPAKLVLNGVGAGRNVLLSALGPISNLAPVAGFAAAGTPNGVVGSVRVSSNEAVELWGASSLGADSNGNGISISAPLVSIMGPLNSEAGSILINSGDALTTTQISLNHNLRSNGGDILLDGDVSLFAGRINSTSDGFAGIYFFLPNGADPNALGIFGTNGLLARDVSLVAPQDSRFDIQGFQDDSRIGFQNDDIDNFIESLFIPEETTKLFKSDRENSEVNGHKGRS
ncbi:MAG: filamentous hemagglutinin N-terminal domain-containing protein, partial [Pseudomonadota bacterium]